MNPTKDQQTVTREGQSVAPLIVGVRIIPLLTHPDARGSLTQLPPQLFEKPIVDAHQVTIRPGMVKGWIVHYIQEDRLFFWQGDLRVVLFDSREDAPTRGMINDLYFGECRPTLCFIPPGVFHSVQNVGDETASHMSFPTVPYDHANPDKYRLPLDTDGIPFDFGKRGW
jgi:dTDP-4-dehydrorhamnose 3,5-epimerase